MQAASGISDALVIRTGWWRRLDLKWALIGVSVAIVMYLAIMPPEDVHVSAERPDGQNVWEAVVDAKLFLGEYIEFQIKLGDNVLLSRVHPSFSPPVGARVYLGMKPEKCVAISDLTQRKAA